MGQQLRILPASPGTRACVRQFSPAVTPEELTPLLAPVGTQTNMAYVHTEEAHMCTLVDNLF